MKHTLRNFLLAATAGVLVFVVASPAAAVNTRENSGLGETRRNERVVQAQTQAQVRRDAALQRRLAATPSAGIMRSCQAREAAVSQRQSKLLELSVTMQTVFDKQVVRVQEYYTNIVLPSGKSVSNYDTLIAAIQDEKANVAATITTATNDVSAFSCTTGDPREHLSLFRTDMQAVKTALKNYRTAVKNLIVEIRSVVGESTSPSPSPAL